MTDLLQLRQNSAHPIFRVELEQAAYNHGYRKANGVADGWLYFKSNEGIPGEVALSSGIGDDGSPWFLAVEHAGAAVQMREELPGSILSNAAGSFHSAFAFGSQAEMRCALSRCFHLSRSLPTFPLSQYEVETRSIGDTEAERLQKQRIGQDIFRKALLDYWGGCCPLNGIREPRVLRASHIVPWAQCQSDHQRLDVFNGLLLSAHWDAAFDAGLISFSDDGDVLMKADLDQALAELLTSGKTYALKLEPQHLAYLSEHRLIHGF